MITTWKTTRGTIPWTTAPGDHPLPLGRNLYHDSRNRAYPWLAKNRRLTSQDWPRHIPMLNQDQVGACTGFEEVGALGTSPVFDALPAGHPALDDKLGLLIYSGAETIDGDGPYPPNDNGSSGPSAAQVAKNLGLISGYQHCFSLNELLDALEDGPVGIGSNWYDSMDRPGSSGMVLVSPNAVIRGGHEYLCRGKDMKEKVLHFDNSWGTSFGINGSFMYTFDTMERLLGEQGDATVSVPLSVPAPIPVPVPVRDPADVAFAGVLHPWIQLHHIGGNGQVSRAAKTWMDKKGL
jgi:hypothetical protein